MHYLKINLLHAEIMNKCIIVYMESFIAYDPSTKTGELHAILTIDISLRSFLFYAAWQNMTHDKSLNLCTWMTMPNHEMKPITMNHKPKTKTKTKTLKQSSKNLGKTTTDQNEDQARITAEQILTLTFGLDSFETDHSVFVALGEFMKVDVGQITSTLPTRTDAKDKLVTAMMILIKEKKARPNYPDIIDRAEAIKKDRSNTSAEKITTEVSTPVVKIEPNENVDTPSSDPFNEQNKKRQRKSK